MALTHKGLLKILKTLGLFAGDGAPRVGHGALAAARIAGAGGAQAFGKIRGFRIQKIQKILQAARAGRYLILAVGGAAIAVIAHTAMPSLPDSKRAES